MHFYTISNKCIFIPFQYEIWSLEKRPFHNSSEELCKKKWGRNGMVIEGSERDGDLGGSGDGSLT